ncbi:fasciclin domain-containing protein [Cochleicola gelatinilyticus]|uniref:fasciclin domain-containing protein n=1 Tax=Cochleicola gelatinilyticus TaxID=1763537 RepID=UPI000838D533|nr:fasciclin domain-containing protein [Cochleicola gelatinilyticus]
MKIKSIVLSLAVVGMLFVSCDDTKKKEAEAKAEAERMEMEASKKMEEEKNMAKMEFDKNTIAAKAMGNPKYSTLVAALKEAGLAETFMKEGEYTVFAPTNDAFAAVPKASMDMLMKPENKAKLQNILKYHVVAGEWNAADVMKAIEDNDNKYTVTTLQGENLTLSVKDGKVMIKDAKGNMSTVADADMDASNGIIHGVDKVLMPKA